MTKRTVLCVLAFAAGLVASARAEDLRGAAAPTVVELFTSQGCSSCPPADRLLYDLAERDDIVAIAWHVSYWDYIGWTDPFATDWSTDRQRAYRGKLGRKYVYTPQMVIDGRHDVVGSRRREVTHIIDTSREVAPERFRVELAHDAAARELVITFTEQRLDDALEIWLIGYSGVHETKVSRGENRGATLRNTHVGRTMDRLGSWDGSGGSLRVPMPAHDDVAGCAVILQEPGQGAIRGAAKLDLVN
jgi:hypothetical protein